MSVLSMLKKLVNLLSLNFRVWARKKVQYVHKVPNIAINRGVLFIHIPKAAGSSLSLNLYGIQIGHKKAKDYFLFDKENFNELKVFSLVRNPISRFESAFYFLIQGGMISADKEIKEKYLDKFEDINHFISSLTPEFIRSGKIIHLVPQYDFLYLNDVCLVDKVYKIESLSEINTFDELGFHFPKEIKNKTKNIEKTPLSDESIVKLKKLYEIDFYKFGYNLEE